MHDPHQDCFDDIDRSLIYTTENIPSARNHKTQDSDEFSGCFCTDSCSQCRCSETSGATFENRIINKTSENPIYECHNNCRCSDACQLRCTQYGPLSELKVKYVSESKGHGLFLEKDILKNCFICEYAGELLEENEASVRYRRYKSDGKMNYIFWVNEHFGDNVKKTIIDPTVMGNIGRFINHSCDPNCYYALVRVNSVFPKLCIFSKTDLKAGEEITMDYGINENDRVSNLEDDEKIQCFCQSVNCIGFLPAHKV